LLSLFYNLYKLNIILATKMYIRHNENNQPVSPQPGFTTVTQFGGTEGWSTIQYEDFNVDYIRYDENNSPIGVGTYQRHDENNSPI
jgi:hypothetical protein